MKKSLVLLLAGLVLVGTSACSTAPKQEEAPSAVASEIEEASADLEEADVTTADLPEETTASATTEAAPAPAKSDLSLGAGSSGRGH